MPVEATTADAESARPEASQDLRLGGKQFVSHAVLSTFTLAVDAVGALAVSVLIGRLLGERPTGQYGYAQAFSAIVLSVFALGLPSYLILSVARADERWPQISREVFGLFTAVCAPLAIGVVVGARLLNPELLGPAAVMLPATVSVFALSFTGMIQACLQAIGDFSTGLKTALATRLLAIVAIVGVHWTGHGIAAYLVALATIHVSITTLLARHLGRRSGGLLIWNLGSWPAHIRAAAPFGVLVVCELLYFRADTVLLRWFKGDVETGYYVAAYAIYTVPLLLSNSVGAAFYPWVVRRRHAGMSQQRARSLVTIALAVFGIGAGAATALIGPLVIRAAFGNRFEASGPVVRLLAIAIPFASVNRLGIIGLKAAGKLRACVAAAGAAAAVAILMNMFVIPELGATGAAVVTVITEGVLLVGAWWCGAWGADRARALPATSGQP